MAVELHEEAAGKVLVINVSGKLTKEDYEHFVPEVDRLMAGSPKVRMLFRMQDFHGWTAGALWEDTKFGMKHFKDIERLAIVGEKSWEHGMAVFCKPFTTAKVRYFDTNDADQAEAWVYEGLPAARETSAHSK